MKCEKYDKHLVVFISMVNVRTLEHIADFNSCNVPSKEDYVKYEDSEYRVKSVEWEPCDLNPVGRDCVTIVLHNTVKTTKCVSTVSTMLITNYWR